MNRPITLKHLLILITVAVLAYGGYLTVNHYRGEALQRKCEAQAIASIQAGISYLSPECYRL